MVPSAREREQDGTYYRIGRPCSRWRACSPFAPPRFQASLIEGLLATLGVR
jgi:hypothetical protein